MQIQASDFKAKCLSLMDKVAETKEEILITKQGKVVAKLLPAETVPQKNYLAI